MTSNLELPEMFQKIAQKNFDQDNLPESADTQMPAEPQSAPEPNNALNATTADQLAQANEAIAALAKEYPIWAAQDIKKMIQALQDARSLSGEKRADMIRKELFKIAHNTKGQGATFGYPLITDIGDHLCRYIERIENIQNEEMNIMRDHINAMDTILKQKLTGDGGTVGQELKDKLLNT